MSVAPGTYVGRYRIESLVGTGGMGAIYRAYDRSLERWVALKLLGDVPDAARRARLVEEARSASALNHPALWVVYEIGEADDTPYIAMELVDGQPLRELVGLPLDLERVLAIARQVQTPSRTRMGARSSRIPRCDSGPLRSPLRLDGSDELLAGARDVWRALTQATSDGRLRRALREAPLFEGLRLDAPA
jgi:Protein kinase domain